MAYDSRFTYQQRIVKQAEEAKQQGGSMEKISIIIPVYKVEHYFEKCIQSVCSQTYKNLEIILVDDGSPDSCPRICDNFAMKDKRIKVIHKENGGLSSARNAGIDASTGTWLMFVDSDDFIAPEMAERLYETACKYHADVAFCTLTAFTEDQDGYHEFKLWDAPPDPDIAFEGSTVLRKSAEERQGLLSGHHVIAWNKIYRKNIFNSLRYPEGQLHEDEATAHHILGACNKIVGINEPLYYYRQRSDSIIGSGENLFRQMSMALAYGDRALFYEQINLSKTIRLIYERYWTTLITTFYLFPEDPHCTPLIKKLLKQMREVETLYAKREDVPFARRVGVHIFCCFPNLISKLFVLSVKLRTFRSLKQEEC